MEGAGATPEDLGAPESWEAADVEVSMKRLLLSSDAEPDLDAPVSSLANFTTSLSSGVSDKVCNLAEDEINQVDQFLREALQNPRERLSVLRLEQEVEKFIRDPTQHQLEFKQLPTSYLRLAAHRVAQHYFLQSMILVDNNLAEGSVTRIIVRKTSDECRVPHIRLADIPVNFPKEEGGIVKLAIKQRPQKHSHASNNSGSLKINQSKSVEERKEDYNRARARIFNSSAHAITTSANPENETRRTDSLNQDSVGKPKYEEESFSRGADSGSSRGVIDSSSRSSRSARIRTEKEPVDRYKPNNRVAIFRDREVESKDPDFDRSYDRYMQRFDPGFGFNTGPYTIQPMYTPAINYNSEFPQLALTHAPQISAEHQPHPVAQHLPGTWASPSNIAGIGYPHPEAMMTVYTPNHVSARSTTPAIYMHSSQYPGQHPAMHFIHPHEHIHQPLSQSLQQQYDATFGLARPR